MRLKQNLERTSGKEAQTMDVTRFACIAFWVLRVCWLLALITYILFVYRLLLPSNVTTDFPPKGSFIKPDDYKLWQLYLSRGLLVYSISLSLLFIRTNSLHNIKNSFKRYEAILAAVPTESQRNLSSSPQLLLWGLLTPGAVAFLPTIFLWLITPPDKNTPMATRAIFHMLKFYIMSFFGASAGIVIGLVGILLLKFIDSSNSPLWLGLSFIPLLIILFPAPQRKIDFLIQSFSTKNEVSRTSCI